MGPRAGLEHQLGGKSLAQGAGAGLERVGP